MSNRRDVAGSARFNTATPSERTVAIVLPYAVSIRDFVHSGALAELLEVPGLRIDIYTQNPAIPEFDSLRTPRVALHKMTSGVSNRVERLLRRQYPVLFADRFEYLRQLFERSPWRRAVAAVVVAFRRLLGTHFTLRLYGSLLRVFGSKPEAPLFVSQPDLVIGTRSLVNSLDYPYILEAARLSYPLLTIASSWDNFTTKGFFPFPVERTIVWNRKMAEELREIFGVSAKRIVIAGYPRFGLIRDTGDFVDAAGYLKSIGLGQYCRFILYTVSYAELTRPTPGEPPLEYRLAREVAATVLDTIPADTCVLVRLHPYSDTTDEAALAGVERLHIFVPGRKDLYVERVMSAADEVHLACQLNFSACVVSMASTISIDALALSRPLINIAFDPTDYEGPPVIRRFYAFNHFHDLVDRSKLKLADSATDVVAFVHRHLETPGAPEADLAAFEREYVPKSSACYPKVVRATVESLLSHASASGVRAATA